MKISAVCAEASSDFFGRKVIEEAKKQYSQKNLSPTSSLELTGCGGQQMQSAGLCNFVEHSIFTQIGFLQVLLNLRKLTKHRDKLIEKLQNYQPDVFLGIDGYSLNIKIAEAMRIKDVPVVHLVAPKLYFNKNKRLSNMEKYVDKLLCLFPYEQDDYKGSNVETHFVGHPLADAIPLEKPSKEQCKFEMGFEPNKLLVSIMPGSRKSMLKANLPVVEALAVKINKRYNNEVQLACALPSKLVDWYQQKLGSKVVVLADQSTKLLMASDAAVVATGTITIEAMCCDTPMIVFYKPYDPIYYLKYLQLENKDISLPNALSPKLVKEFIVTSLNKDTNKIVELLSEYLAESPEKMVREFRVQHRRLRRNSAAKIAEILLQYSPS